MTKRGAGVFSKRSDFLRHFFLASFRKWYINRVLFPSTPCWALEAQTNVQLSLIQCPATRPMPHCHFNFPLLLCRYYMQGALRIYVSQICRLLNPPPHLKKPLYNKVYNKVYSFLFLSQLNLCKQTNNCKHQGSQHHQKAPTKLQPPDLSDNKCVGGVFLENASDFFLL